MALSTTQAIWRSGGGDNSRTAYCGSGIMAAQFYIPAANAAGANVKVSSASGANNLILPANAVVLSVVCSGNGTALKTFDMGYAALDGSPAVNDAYASGVAADAASTTQPGTTEAGTGLGVAVNEMVYVTAGGTTLTTPITGFITYFVQDPLAGQQNV